MRTENVSDRNQGVQSMKTNYAAALSAALVLTLVLGLFGAIPGVAVALEEGMPGVGNAYSIAEEDIDKGTGSNRGGGEPLSFASQREAIEYFVAKEAEERAGLASRDELRSFASQREAIEYFVAKEAEERAGIASGDDLRSFASEREAIEYFVAKEAEERAGLASGDLPSFASEREAIEYFVAQNSLERAANASFTCSRPASVLAANPELVLVRPVGSC